jgi:integrase
MTRWGRPDRRYNGVLGHSRPARRGGYTGLQRDDIGTEDFAARGGIWPRLMETKTTGKADAPRLQLKGRAARAVFGGIEAAQIDSGPLFRQISKTDRALHRPLAPDAVRVILRHRLQLAGLPPDYVTPHGLRAGFLTQAALDGATLAAAMKLSLHRSALQAQRYYADVNILKNPATNLLE